MIDLLNNKKKVDNRVLEDQNRGIGAKEIITWSTSIGGAVEGEALKSHVLDRDIKYVFVKNQTFASLLEIIPIYTGELFGKIARKFGWDMDCVESSRSLQHPEIIINCAEMDGEYSEKDSFEEINDSLKFDDSGIIPEEYSLARVLLQDANSPRNDRRNNRKIFIGTNKMQDQQYSDVSFITDRIKELLIPA